MSSAAWEVTFSLFFFYFCFAKLQANIIKCRKNIYLRFFLLHLILIIARVHFYLKSLFFLIKLIFFIWQVKSTNFVIKNLISSLFHVQQSNTWFFLSLFFIRNSLYLPRGTRCMLSEIECRPWNCNFKVEKIFPMPQKSTAEREREKMQCKNFVHVIFK